MSGPPNSTLDRRAGRHDAARRMNYRVLVPALVISAALHAIVLAFLGFSSDPDRILAPRIAPALVAYDPVMRALDIAVVATEPAPVETQLRERPALGALAPAPGAWSPAQAAPARPVEPRTDAGASVRDRLQYRMGSTEVWRPQAPLPAEEASPDERVRARVATQLQEYNDSVAAEAAASARATDWTVKDGNGGKWGVSPGSIHLGNVTLPLPFTLSPPPEVSARVRSWTEIQDQASRVEGRQVFDERVRAIRERAEQERANPGSTATSAPPPPPPPPPPPGGGSTGGG
jgi:hypothetical protein